MEPEGSLLCSEELIVGPCSEKRIRNEAGRLYGKSVQSFL
jgi:hypothetical protein